MLSGNKTKGTTGIWAATSPVGGRVDWRGLDESLLIGSEGEGEIMQSCYYDAKQGTVQTWAEGLVSTWLISLLCSVL